MRIKTTETKRLLRTRVVYTLVDLDRFEKEAVSMRGQDSLLTDGTTSKDDIDQALADIKFTANYLRKKHEKKNKPQE